MIFMLAALIAAAPGVSVATPPRPYQPLERLISRDDYPAAALAAKEQGSVAVRLQVAAMGRVTACDIVKSSGSRQLDVASCLLMQRRARFHPATNDQGGSVAGEFDHQINWQLP